jgi:methylmalonyl-CoA mutase
VSDSFAERMARNIQLLLLEESHLGRVLDPAAGSWYVEDLTAGIAAKAWEFMQELERAGGYRAALEAGLLGERVAATRSARESDIAHRRTAVTGVNEFPNLAEKPVAGVALDGVARYGAAFEALRDRSDAYLAEHGARPRILLVPLGPLAEHTVRVTFAANLLASGGIETVDPGTQTADGVAEAVRESGTQVAVLCGADKRYAAEAVETVAALRAAGVRHVLLAGPEKALGERLAAADWPDGFLTLRIDAASTLSDLLGKLGA